MKRLDFDANTPDEAVNYLQNRTKQMLRLGVALEHIETYEAFVRALFKYLGRAYQAIYVLNDYRGQGVYVPAYESNKLPILTTVECQVGDYLERREIPHSILTIEDSNEYKMIQQFYGDKKSERSQVYLMNHIDEGRAILQWIDASPLTHAAFCLHPLFQSDLDLANTYAGFDWTKVHPQALLLTMEYRNIANAYLSHRKISSLDEIQLSPLKEVNDMLIADKVQNRKDFDLYHKATHPRSAELTEYFDNWLQKLGISEELYQEFAQRLLQSDQLKVTSSEGSLR